ncbi:YciI family protein [Desulfoplanes sp. PS50]
MQFVVIGHDGKDDKALDRRLAAREAHLATFKENHAKGVFLYAVALLDNDGTMNGSIIVCDFPSEEALKTEWLDTEPYVLGKVWESVEIRKGMVPPLLLGK